MIYKIYIHGRPQGQDIWPQCENANDSHYLNSFLDSGIGSKVDAVLQTDIWQGNAYYTYLRRKNVVEKIARGGSGSSYFAITIRFDQSFCRNVNSLFNLLTLVYNKFCNDNLVKTNNGTIQYLVNRFEERTDLINQISKVVGDNVEMVIAPYVEKIKNSKDTIDRDPLEYALLDADSPSFVDDMLKHKLVVSPDYATLHSQIQPLKSQNSSLATELEKWKTNANTLQQDKLALQNQVVGLSEEKVKLEKSLSSASENAKKTFTSKLREKEEELIKVKAVADKKEQSLQSLIEENNRLREANEKSAKTQELSESFENIKEPLINFSRLVASRFPENPGMGIEGSHPTTKKGMSMDKLKTWLSVGTFILVFCTFGLSIVHSFFGSLSSPNSTNLVDSLMTKDSLTNTLNVKNDSMISLTKPIVDIGKITNILSGTSIDIENAKQKKIKVNTPCILRVGVWKKKGQNIEFQEILIPEEVDLFVNGIKLKRDSDGKYSYTPVSVGKLTIECKIDGSTLETPKAKTYSIVKKL